MLHLRSFCRRGSFLLFAAAFTLFILNSLATAQQTQELSDKEGIPVLVKHLPAWERKADTAIFVTKLDEVQTFLNDREVLNHSISFRERRQSSRAIRQESCS